MPMDLPSSPVFTACLLLGVVAGSFGLLLVPSAAWIGELHFALASPTCLLLLVLQPSMFLIMLAALRPAG